LRIAEGGEQPLILVGLGGERELLADQLLALLAHRSAARVIAEQIGDASRQSGRVAGPH
jgi:hypothetical protein